MILPILPSDIPRTQCSIKILCSCSVRAAKASATARSQSAGHMPSMKSSGNSSPRSTSPSHCEQGGLQDLRQNSDEGTARLGGQEAGDLLGFLPFHKPGVHQLFQDGGAGGGGADALPLRVLRHFTCTGGLHTLENGILHEMLGRGCFALLHLDGVHR